MSKHVKRKTQAAEVLEQASAARIQLLSNKQALVDGCGGVLEYSSEKIKLDIGKKEVSFLGLNLSMDDFNLYEINIKGDIMSIEFSD